MRAFLGCTIRTAHATPKYLICDKGTQFWCDSFKNWCQRRGIRPRFGAVQQHGSISVIERLIRSMKNECTRRILVSLALEAMRRELTLYLVWFNEHWPSQALGGRTPNEVYTGQRPANATFRFEPRTMWPRRSSCAAPQAQIKGRRGAKLTLVIGYLEGRKHLPVVELRRAA